MEKINESGTIANDKLCSRSGTTDQALGFWKEYLADYEGRFEIMPDYRRSDVPEWRREKQNFSIREQEYDWLTGCAAALEVSLETLLLSVLGWMFHIYSREKRFFLCRYSEYEHNSEVLCNMLPLRYDFNGITAVREILSMVERSIGETNQFTEINLEEVYKSTGMNQNGQDPISAVAVVFHGIDKCGEQKLYCEALQRVDFYDIWIDISAYSGSVEISLNYSREYYRAETIEKFLEGIQVVLRNFAEKVKIAELEVSSVTEKKIVLEEWNNTFQNNYPLKSLGQVFEETALKNKEKLAIVSNDKTITYYQLLKYVNCMANYFLSQGIEPGAVVGIITDKSLETMAMILAIVKAGAAYLPISSRHPQDRITYMLDEAGVKFVVSAAKYPTFDLTKYQVLYMNENDCGEYPEYVSEDLGGLDSMAYVLYTSGSTGKPKGVMVDQRGIMRLVMNVDYVELKKEMNFLQTSSLTFDVSVFEVWGSILNGLTMYILDEDELIDTSLFRKKIVENQIHIIYLTTPVFHSLVNEKADLFMDVDCIVVAGDVLSKKHAEIVRTKNRRIKIINAYGPTENTTFSTTYLVDDKYKEFVPIGRPINHSTAYVLDQYLNILPRGAVGELYLGGAGIARGYINKDGLTKERFIKDPYFNGQMYRSGDLARWLPDGNLDFLGRVDNQIKIRGFRIELDEIRNVIVGNAAVKDCYITTAEDNNIIVAYIVPVRLEEDWKTLFQEQLPDYMLPAIFVEVEALPLNVNGKVDKKSLPSYKQGREAGQAQELLPVDKKEEVLVSIWREILGVDELTCLDEFDRLGGTSLDAMKVLSRIRKYGYLLDARSLMKSRTIRDIAGYMREDGVN